MCAYVLSCFSHVQLFATPWTIAHQAPLGVGFSKQEYWSELPCLHPRDLPNPGIKPMSLMSPVGSLPLGHLGSPLTYTHTHMMLHAPNFYSIQPRN